MHRFATSVILCPTMNTMNPMNNTDSLNNRDCTDSMSNMGSLNNRDCTGAMNNINETNTVILACTSLVPFVAAAQTREGTCFRVVEIDRDFHSEPATMKEQLAHVISELPQEIETVLVAMGFCGGAWDHVVAPRRLVIPRFDDCVSLLLNTNDTYHANLKEPGHLYLYENDPEAFSALGLMRSDAASSPEFASISQEDLFHYWFDNYHTMDIIDTGLNDCYSEEYVIAAQAEADKIDAALGYAQGSNHTLEKLVSGRWDEQFLVAQPGELIRHGNFFE